MNYQETLSYIHQTPKFSRILGNTMLKKLLAHLGNPQDALDFIHVAGPNGKGSVSIMLAEILKNAGLRQGIGHVTGIDVGAVSGFKVSIVPDSGHQKAPPSSWNIS